MKYLLRKTILIFAKLICFLFGIVSIVTAQSATQTIRGTVIDKVSQSPIAGAIVTLLHTQPLQGTATDANGNFTLKQVAVGRQTIRATYMGYKEITLSNLSVNAGKELVLNIQMEEDIVQVQEVVINGTVQKNKPLNEMSVVSTRTFSVEETQKFAAAVNDPARMATSFAGVVAAGDGNNIISVRGNSPNGLLWRMEGVDIPNPNHFSNVGTSGGGISILSAQLLGNSDFMTGAFGAEYGNALSGVFDLRLRKGNNQKREHTFQAGVLGLDLASEGPIQKGYDGSYLVNYRYSTLSLLGLMGLNVVGDAVTNFQDLSFNVSLPTSKLGTFGVFGFGGLSSQVTEGKKDSILWKEESFKRYYGDYVANTGTIGFNNLKLFGNKTYLKTTLIASGNENKYLQKKYNLSYALDEDYEQSYIQNRIALSSTLTHKFDARNSLRTGIIVSRLGYRFYLKDKDDSTQQMLTKLDNKGATETVQAFAQWNHKFNNRLSANLGLHSMYLNLNQTASIEPRASVKYDLTIRQNISFGYGLHSQLQPLGTYFARADVTAPALNKNLGFTRAHHFVFAHDINLSQHTHLKTETYYQHLFDAPVSTEPGSYFSLLNEVEGFTPKPLQNSGLGRNYGVELTLERFLHKNLYYLWSASLYQSEFRAPNGQWFNTRFNTNYATTFTAGKEWQLSEKRKNKILGLNLKLVYVGGFRRTPIDEAASIAKGSEVYIESKSYTIQNPDYMRLDVRFSIKRNYNHATTTLSLDLQNATNRMNIGGQYYDEGSRSVKYWYQAGLIPILAYRIEF